MPEEPRQPGGDPVGLTEIVGQASAVSRLQRMLAGGRMPHALLFFGPRGVGRRTTAEALARTLLCAKPDKTPEGLRACGACESCRLAAGGSHPDLHPVYKELARYHDDPAVRNRVMQDLGIAVIRSFLIAPAMQGATLGRGKVFLVREADRMSIPAQNALLKTLEEPPAGVTIILLARQAEQMLPTTRSRCASVRFGPLPAEFVRERLQAAAVAAEEAEFWSRFTEGSIGRALELHGLGLYEVQRDLTGRLAALATGGEDGLGEHLADLQEKLSGEFVRRAREADGGELSRTLAGRQAAAALLELVASVYRDAMAVACGAETPPIHADDPRAIETVAERFPADQLAEILEQLTRFEGLLWRNVNAKLLWDNLAITCESAAPLGSY
jgi:DNA polymerase-3 subunit delta'